MNWDQSVSVPNQDNGPDYPNVPEDLVEGIEKRSGDRKSSQSKWDIDTTDQRRDHRIGGKGQTWGFYLRETPENRPDLLDTEVSERGKEVRLPKETMYINRFRTNDLMIIRDTH